MSAISYPQKNDSLRAFITSISVTSSNSAGAYVAGTASDSSIDLTKYDDLDFEYSGVGNTGGPCDVWLQDLDDGTYFDYVHFNQAATATATKQTVHAALTGAVNAVGSGTTPALAAGTCRGGHWGPQMRLVSLSGTGTTVGAAQSVKIYGRVK